MATACKDVCKRFYDLIDTDEDFFDDYGRTTEQQEEIMEERAMVYMREACAYLRRHCSLDVNLVIDKNAETEEYEFAVDLTEVEMDLVALGMRLRHYEHKVDQLGPVINSLSASELKFAASPNAERSTYLALIAQFSEKYDVEISHYMGRDRATGGTKAINYSISEDEE